MPVTGERILRANPRNRHFARNRPATLNNQATNFRPSSAFYDIKKTSAV
ncbi:UDP-2,3-diacylglucosamine hydrolase [Ligilactobacillus ruminis]|uniref:UDP-2,3-diacylglucosamine hydrolase n=1 Tax=Ligilactobacillus ruminis TaxID=1623 RepID=A0A8B2Z9T8_9LACO|nr:UDP-2,3-diacylglucosamine hydrolase [Ligilactobacillus ruminis]